MYDLELKPVKDLDFFSHSELVSYYVDAPLYNDCFAFVRIQGVAMSPAFNSSDIVVIKKIANFDIVIFGEPYFIIMDEQRVLRYLKPNDNKTFLLFY